MPTASPPAERDDAKVAAACAGAIGLALTIAAFALFDGRTGLSVAMGAVIGVANLLAMRAIIRSLIRAADEEEAANAKPASPESAEGSQGSQEERAAAEATAEPTEKKSGAAWGLFAAVKMAVLFGGIWFLLTKRMVDPIPLVVGYGVLPLGIAASALVTSLSPTSKRRR